jgi:sugar/nucleoside kinase (ribokinase family)
MAKTTQGGSNPMRKILILGGVSYDTVLHLPHFPDPIPQTLLASRYREKIGSTGAGKSLALKRLGLNVHFHGVIGADRYGDLIRQRFAEENIPFDYDIDPNGTERHVNLMSDKTGERISFFLTSPPADIPLQEDVLERLIAASDLVILNIASYCKRLIPLLQRHGKETWIDLHDYTDASDYYTPFLEQASMLMFSSERHPQYRQTMTNLIQSGKQLVICTHGAKGATALLPSGEWIKQPVLPYPVVDTNGAGDNFFSGLLYGLEKGHSVATSLRLAAVVAGLCVSSSELIAQDLSEDRVLREYNRWYGALRDDDR